MLMSDTWQPAVLQLLPFSPNDASSPHPQSPSLTPSATNSPRLKSFPFSPDHSRGFPVLAVTRREKNEGGGGGGGGSDTFNSRGASRGGGGGGAWPISSPSPRIRAASERMTRSQTFVDSASCLSSSHPRAKSEYHPRRSPAVSSGAAGGKVKANGGGLQSRDLTTCSITDMNERIMPRVGLRPDSTSPDSGAGSLRNSPYVTSSGPEAPCHNGVGGSTRGFPKPSFPPNALSPSNSTAAGVIGTGNGNGNGAVGEGRYMVSKNGMWRSVTLTPGEMELKRHRDLLERVSTPHPAPSITSESKRVSTVHPAPSVASESKGQYHKMNIRDLPRSTTPVNDHDPDKLNMKQVIAFLQSKGKSQADAVVLPRRLKGKVNQTVTLPRNVNSGVLRGSVRKATASSTAVEIIMRSSGRHLLAKESRDALPSSAVHPGQRGEVGGEVQRTSSPALNVTRRSTAKERRELRGEHREYRHEKPESLASTTAARRSQQKPFRLHRFLTMVPSAREPLPLASEAFPPASTSPLYSAAPLVTPPSKSAHKERTLCLDLANQSKTQSTQSKTHTTHSKTHTTQSKGEATNSKQQSKVHYRLAVGRPRPSSLRVEQDIAEAQSKLSADFGDRDAASRITTFTDSADDVNTKETKNVIRLPFVMVDSEDEDTESKRPTKPQSQKHTKHTKASRQKTDVKQTNKDETVNEIPNGSDSVDGIVWPAEVKEVVQDLQSSSVISNSSSMLPVAPTLSTTSMLTMSHSDIVNDQNQIPEDPPNKLPDAVNDNRRVHLIQENGSGEVSNEGPMTNKTVKVNVPMQNDPTKDVSTKQKTTDYVTLSLRKERHRTRERTYMSEMGGSEACSDDTCAARANSESVRMSIKSEDVASWAS